MTHVIVEPGLSATLEESRGPLTLCDSGGRVLGVFYPRVEEVDYEDIERARPKLSKEEIERRRQGPTYSTSEVIQRLKS